MALVMLNASSVLAQTTITLSGTLPFDLSGFGKVALEGNWQWQHLPWTVGASAALTPQGWDDARLSLSYQISNVQASGSATLTPQGLKSAEMHLKTELAGLISVENTLNFGRRGFRNGKITLKLGPNALNVAGNAQFSSAGIIAPTGTLNFSLPQEHGDFSGTTTFTAHGFKQQSLSAVGYLSDDWTLTMTSLLTIGGLQSQSFDLATTLWDGLVSLSFGATLEGQGITSETISLDLMLEGLFMQASLAFAGLELSGFQIMANGFIGDFSLDTLIMGSLEGLQLAQLMTSGDLFGFGVSLSLDISTWGLDNLSASISRAVGPWTLSGEGIWGLDGFQSGALKASYSLKLP